MQKSAEHAHGNYVIRTLTNPKTVRARAFVGRQAVCDAEEKTLEGVLATMRAKLDTRDVQEQGERRDDVPTPQGYKDAFAVLDTQVRPFHWDMLNALLNAPDHTLTTTEIARAAGYKAHTTANEKLGKLGRMFAETLNFQPHKRADGTPIWTTALAVGDDATLADTDAQWRWRLRPEVVECLKAMPRPA